MQAAQRHGVPLAGRTPAAFAARPAQRTRPEEGALFVTGLRALRRQHHSGRAAQRVQRPHARAPTPPAPGHHLNLADPTRTRARLSHADSRPTRST